MWPVSAEFFSFVISSVSSSIAVLCCVVTSAVLCYGMCYVLCRLWVLRVLTSLLVVMLGTFLVRAVVWGAVWLLTGSHFWIFPNLTSETVSERVRERKSVSVAKVPIYVSVSSALCPCCCLN